MKFILGYVIVLQVIQFGCGNRFSNFRKTEVFDEVLDAGLKTTVSGVTLMTCAKICSDDADCRRLKFCQSEHVSGTCKLYEDGKDCPHEADGRECTCFQKMKQCEDDNCACAIGFYGNNCDKVIKDCSDGKNHGLQNLNEKLSYIQPDGAEEPFEVLCEFQHGGLTVIQSRKLEASFVDFNRSMEDYVRGFGRPRYNHWLGLKYISLLFASVSMKCNILMAYQSDYCQVYYDTCHVGNEADGYRITISDYSTSFSKLCGNSLTNVDNINNAPFSTYDSDSSGYKCASKMAAGWWYASTTTCTQGNLNAPLVASSGQGNIRLKWILDKGDTTFTSSVLRITPS